MVRFFGKLFPSLITKNFHSQFSKKQIKGRFNTKDTQELIEMLNHLRSGDGFLNDLNQSIEDSLLKKIECPTLVIHSKNDNSVSFDHALHAKKMIKNVTLETIDNDWGHLIWLGEDSKMTCEKMIKFLQE